MGSITKGSKSKCESTSHQLLKQKAKNRVNDLQGIFTDLQSARKESRANDIAVLEEQVHQMLREWNSELNEPSPASSLAAGSLGSFSEELARLLQHCDEEDDAISALVESKAEPNPQVHHGSNESAFQHDCIVNHDFQGFNESKMSTSSLHDTVVHNSDVSSHLDIHDFDLHGNFELNTMVNKEDMISMDSHPFGAHQDFHVEHLIGNNDAEVCIENVMPNILPNISPPPSAFLGPKCALWDCFRPAQGSKWCQDYCSSGHSVLALNEGLTGMTPILRPGGIGLKDGPLFAALSARTQGKEVGIPTCEGAATTKSPWNAPELFDLTFFEGETIREWLFFDKPRRAFESGNRKQRSLPDYSGRGWHESRKQVIKEHGGQKRSYYMDPQPSNSLDWHLYEYEIINYSTCALYRMELKHTDGKKSPKGKVTSDSLADLQKKMGRLTAEGPTEDGQTVKGRTKGNKKGEVNTNLAQNQIT